jgi:putative cardiolipin synthase
MKLALLLLSLVLAHSALALDTDSIPYPFHVVQNGGKNKVMFIDDGIAGLAMRINMIRRAKKSIAVEYFIFNTDTSARIISRELVAAAKRGVAVRLLIDKSKPVYKFDEYHAKELEARGVQVRYYNASPLWRVSTLQFRTHRKLIAVDDVEAITGGRNIGNDYFDLSHEFNFDDSDLHVMGPMAKVMRESFDKFFNHKITERPKFADFNDPQLVTEAKNFFRVTEDEVKARARIEGAGESYLRSKTYHVCPTLTFATDAPGADLFARMHSDYLEKFRYLRRTLHEKISVVDKHITLSSPYMIDSQQTEEMMNTLLRNGSKIDIYTNSLASTDATYVAAHMYMGLKDWRAHGINVYLNDGKWMPKNLSSPGYVQHAKTGTHSKVQVYETKTYSEVMVGTYNIDHRSNYYNAEMALFCKGNEDLTREVKASIKRNMDFALKVTKDGKSVIGRDGRKQDVFGADASQIRKMKLITLPSWLLKELL